MTGDGWVALGVGIAGVLYPLFAGLAAWAHRQNQREHAELKVAVAAVDAKVSKQEADMHALSAIVSERVKATDQRFEGFDAKLDRGASRMDEIHRNVGSVAADVAEVRGYLRRKNGD